MHPGTILFRVQLCIRNFVSFYGRWISNIVGNWYEESAGATTTVHCGCRACRFRNPDTVRLTRRGGALEWRLGGADLQTGAGRDDFLADLPGRSERGWVVVMDADTGTDVARAAPSPPLCRTQRTTPATEYSPNPSRQDKTRKYDTSLHESRGISSQLSLRPILLFLYLSVIVV